MSWPEFQHEAMATAFAIVIADHDREYARQAAAACFLELDRLESELSRYVESSDIARANRILRGETIAIGDDTLQCLLLAAEVAVVTHRAFDAAYATRRGPGDAPDAPAFTLDPSAHTLTSHVERLHLDLGAVGKGYALDRMAEKLGEWAITTACLHGGGSTALALDPPAGGMGWSVGIGEGATHRLLTLRRAALSGSGLAVQGEHITDPRAGAIPSRRGRTWALASEAGLSDALSTAFFVSSGAEIARFCALHPEIGAAWCEPDGPLVACGALIPLLPAVGS